MPGYARFAWAIGLGSGVRKGGERAEGDGSDRVGCQWIRSHCRKLMVKWKGMRISCRRKVLIVLRSGGGCFRYSM